MAWPCPAEDHQLHPGLCSGHLGHIPCLPEVMKTERANIWPRRPLRHWHLETRHSHGRRVCWMPRATCNVAPHSWSFSTRPSGEEVGAGGGLQLGWLSWLGWGGQDTVLLQNSCFELMLLTFSPWKMSPRGAAPGDPTAVPRVTGCWGRLPT